MNNIHVNTRTQVKTRKASRANEIARAKAELSQGAGMTMAAVPTLIGIWAAACFVGAMISSGGPLVLAKSWFSAFMGM